MRLRLLSIYLLLGVITHTSPAQTESYRDFDNFNTAADASVVNCFIQDPSGLIWLGTNKGLYSYNGFGTQMHTWTPAASRIKTDTKINCGLLYNNHTLCLGTDNGVLFYNILTDNYESSPVAFPADVRSLVLQGNQLRIGSLNGLYSYDTARHSLSSFDQKQLTGIPNRTIYSLLRSRDNTLYVGTYNGLCYLPANATRFRTIDLTALSGKSSLLVNALLEDWRNRCIWIGTEGYLFRYTPGTGQLQRMEDFNGNSIKSLATDDENNLLIGTDNGLYVFNPFTNQSRRIVHDSRSPKSLTNNIIWSIFIDKNKNSWLGTDYGFSHYRHNKNYSYIPISQITGLGDGNQLQAIYKDSRNNLWLGGTNGLICSPADGSSCLWYKMGDSRYPISHNRIRSIYEDKEHILWVATDGSINRYDYQRKQFVRYNIVDRSRTRNANWAYQITEDNQGRLWIATCLGGVFAVDKKALIANGSQPFVAEQNFYKQRGGLSDNYILQLVCDKQNNIWALTYNNQLNRINTRTGKVEVINFDTQSRNLANGSSYALLCDKEGFIWVGYSNGLSRINPRTAKVQPINLGLFKDIRIKALTEENNRIWISSSDGTFAINKSTLQLQHIRLISKDFSCNFYDSLTHKIFMGSVDGFAVFPAGISGNSQPTPQLLLTGMYANDQLLQPNRDYNGRSIRTLPAIALPYNRNNVSFEFSDLTYSQDEDSKYIYRLEGAEDEWHSLKSNSNRISYTNLAPGNYVLHIGAPSPDGSQTMTLLSYAFSISQPWYYNVEMRILYILLIIALIVWVIKYFVDKHYARIERIEREKSLEVSKMKIDFFTNVSHDFKTPLSLILGPVSQLLPDIKNASHKKQLELVQKNALALNELIQQVIGFERMDGSALHSIIASHIEIVEFCKGIFSVYDDAFKARNLHADFQTDIESLVVNVDVVKFESILNNLLSNAVKYTPAGGTINFMLEVTDNELQMRITDSGVGIPAADLPYIFDRFYQSDKTRNTLEGSGIGLYLVKNYVEMHQGTISVQSAEELGTTFSIRLPLEAIKATSTYNSNEPVSIDDQQPLILVVEDNPEVSEFILSVVRPHYRVVAAHNGKTGLDAAMKLKPDLIISDIMMPVMDGMEMCKQIRKQQELSTTPIIMLTAKDDKRTEERSIELEVNVFISKPFDAELLLMRINQLLATGQKLEKKVRLQQIAEPKTIEARSWDEKFLSDITGIIEDKIADADLNVNRLSELSGISSKQIYRRIKQLTGLSPVDYIRSIRLKKAAMLLSQQKFTVAEVMYLVGFSNYSYFSKCFQAKYGTTPKQYSETKAGE
ncbi:MAG: Sensor histidine kinase YycG [Bacteroidota bacterium]|jgi:signal transduction histidine kinase/ligand-binding sensor domain-containing protein/CheY-like chemotaxis protein/AraC-like DNA-binding protein